MKLIKDLGIQKPKETSKFKVRFGMYECPLCFTINRHSTKDVKANKIKSCMKCASKNRTLKHGDSHTKLHQIWLTARDRCRNKNNKNYSHYGKRGIKFSTMWDEYLVFKSWSLDNGYIEGLTIDRKNNDGNYEPSNCRWVTMKVQSLNRRRKHNSTSKYEGVSWKSANKKWVAQYKKKYIGIFTKEEDAAKAVQEWKDER